MAKLLLLGLTLVLISSAYVECTCNYNGFLTCLNDTILNEWDQLVKDSSSKIASDKAKSVKCLRTVSCTKSCEPASDFTTEIDDPNIQKLVVDIRNVWDKWPRSMQACFLEKVRDNFFKELEKRVKKSISDFDLPDNLGPLPMPPASLYEGDRQALKSYVQDKIGALLCLQSCSYEDKKKVVKCMKKEIDKPLGKCVSDKLCSSGDCKKSFKPTCSAVSQSIQDIVKDGEAKLSSFDDGSQTSALKELKICKEKSESIEGSSSGWYKASDYLQIFQTFTHVKKDGNVDKFKNMLKDLFNSYFDGDSFCSSQDC